MKYNLRILFLGMLMLTLLSCMTSATEPFVECLYGGKDFCTYAGLADIPEVNGYSAYAYNVETGSVMLQKNANDPVYPASTVKLMTALVAYENIPDLSTPITASETAVRATKGTNMAIKAGEIFTAEQLLYGLLVTGANDAANVLAEYVGGSIEGFCILMNEKAAAIGAYNTNFTNPTGIHNEAMITTAKDIGIIAYHFYFVNALYEMSCTTRYIIPESPQSGRQRILLNRNLLISRVRSDKFYDPIAKGMSLGNTPEAGECIVTSTTDSAGLTYICVIMNAYADSEVNTACSDSAALLRYFTAHFALTTVLSPKTLIAELPVHLAVDNDYVMLLPASELKALLPIELDFAADITTEPRVSEDYATAPVTAGETFGEVVVKYKDETVLGTVPLVAGHSIDKSNVLYLLDRAKRIVLGEWFRVFAITALVLLCIYFILSVRVSSRKRSRRKHHRR